MSWVYRPRHDPRRTVAGNRANHFEVGFYTPAGEWVPAVSSDSETDAQGWVNYLNGGAGIQGVTPS